MDPIPHRERAPVPARTGGYAPGPGDRERLGDATLERYAWLVFEGRRTVLSVVVASLLLATVYLFLAIPLYAARSVVQLEPKPMAVAGTEDAFDAPLETPAPEPQIEIIRSRELIGGVVDALRLDVEVTPRALPLVGEAVARRYRGTSPAPPVLGFSSYAWGGERIRVERLEVPAALVGEPLLLTAMDGGRYVVDDPDGARIVEGAVGAVARAGAERAPVELQVSELVARPGTQFWLRKQPRDDVINGLREALRVTEKGRNTGVLVLELEGSDPVVARVIVGGVAGAYLRQNVERRSAEAVKRLQFIESQLPSLRSNVDAAEAALNAYRLRSGSVDTSKEAKGMLDRQVQLDKEIADAEVERSKLRQTFTEQHPNVVAATNKVALLRAERAQLAGRLRTVPKAEVDTARLGRELKDATDLYVSLLNEAQELRVVKSGTVGDVRIIDPAYVPPEPGRPRQKVVLALALLLGLGCGLAAAILRDSWGTRAETAEDVESLTGLPVYVTVPHSDSQARLARSKPDRHGAPRPALAEYEPTDLAVEAIRSLRTALQFALVESPNNIVAMTGPAPGVGKSFLAVNLAQVQAAAGSKVVLVDCDLRRGRLHRQLGVDREPGVSDVVTGTASLDDVLQRRPGQLETELYLVATGRIPPNPAELLSSASFEAFLLELSKRFDLVILDTPPLLAVTDAMLVARIAGVNFLALRAGKHTNREIESSVKEFALNRIKLHGMVLNDLRLEGRSRYGGYVRYEYASDRFE
jgi:tyrosine-protein kinase Etk/Wzc